MEKTSASDSATAGPDTPSAQSRIRSVIEIEHLRRVYQLGQTRVPALRGVTLTIPRGQFVAITGPSGSGKSTLMNLLGLLDTPTSGRYWLNGQEVSRLPADTIADLRNRHIGFVFQ